jgi:Cu+-exporting ATPase
VAFEGVPLDSDEQRWIHSLAQHSTHPLSVRVAEFLGADFTEPVRSFEEHAGCGIGGVIGDHELLLGSRAWLESRGINLEAGARLEPSPSTPSSTRAGNPDAGSTVHVALDGALRGCFALENALRAEMDESLERLSRDYELTLLSGDNSRQRELFAALFHGRVRFGQTPLDKLEFIQSLQRAGHSALMVGDGLNDAGALKQSDVGVAVVENISAFSPASDVIVSAAALPRLDAVLRLARQSVRVVRAGFLLSSLYNVVGVSIAAAGLLSPVVCAILMPISSISVVAFSCGATAWAARRSFGDKTKLGASAASEGEPGANP